MSITAIAKNEIRAACLWCRGSGFDGSCEQCAAFEAILERRLESRSEQLLAIFVGSTQPLTPEALEHGKRLAVQLGLA